MTQNTSSAVMAQRAEPHDSLDFFPTPPWATRALIEHVVLPQMGLLGRKQLAGMTAWEPAAGAGDMARPLAEYFEHVYATDIKPMPSWFPSVMPQHDFLMPYVPKDIKGDCDFVITNPPFRLAQDFVERARDVALTGIAVLVRTAFLEGVGRWKELFSLRPPSVVAQFTERVVMHKGKLSKDGSTATAYCWIVWLTGRHDTRMIWIPPCRKQLEREGDYR